MVWAILVIGGVLAEWGARRLWRGVRAKRVWVRWVRRVGAGLCAILTPLLLAGGGYAYWYTHRTQPAPVVREIFHGVWHVRDVRQSPRPMVISVVEIDLSEPGIEFLVTPPKPVASGHTMAAQMTSEFLAEHRLQLAINANYFYPFIMGTVTSHYPRTGDGVNLCGFAASRGNVYSNKKWVEGTLFISKDNRASFEEPVGDVYNAIAGNGFLVRDGVPLTSFGVDEPVDKLYPRAALGLSRDHGRMIWMVIDGKQPGYSEGATLAELANILVEHGAYDAIRLDEGGSSTIAWEERPGRPRLLNVPTNHRIPYNERVVANHLGVFAKRVHR
jgi:hypothetical protein